MVLGSVHLTENLATTQNSNGVEKIARILNDVGLLSLLPNLKASVKLKCFLEAIFIPIHPLYQA